MYGIDWLTLVIVPLIVGLIGYYLTKILDLIGKFTRDKFVNRRLEKELTMTTAIIVQIAEERYAAGLLKPIQGAFVGLSCCIASFLVGVILLYASPAENSVSPWIKISFMFTGSILCWQTALFFRFLSAADRVHFNPAKAVEVLEKRINKNTDPKVSSEIKLIKPLARNIERARKAKLTRLMDDDLSEENIDRMLKLIGELTKSSN